MCITSEKQTRGACLLCLYPPPGGGAEQDQDGENLQPAHDHAQGHDPLGQPGEGGEVAAGADGFQAGAHVADAGEGGAERDGEGLAVQGDHQGGGEDGNHIGPQEDQQGVEGGLAHQLAVQLHHLHTAGVGDAVDLPADGPEENQHPGALHAAAGGPGAGPAEHEQNNNHLGELRPQHKVGGAEAGGGDDGGHLKYGVPQALPQAGVDPQVGDGEDWPG